MFIQRYHPFGRLNPRQTFFLPVENIHPVVRLAHRVRQVIDIPERIIFDQELVLVLAGNGVLALGQERVPFAAHDLLFIPPFVPHAFLPSGRGEGEHIAIHFDFAPGFPAFTADPEQRPPYAVQLTHALQVPSHLSLTPGHRIESEVLTLLREWTSDSPLARLAVTNHMLSILIDLLRASGTLTGGHGGNSPHTQQTRVEQVIAFIRQHLAQEFAAADLAAVAAVSTSRLNVIFHQQTGYSPMEYVSRLRVEKARQLLGDIRLSIKEIAAQAGFQDSFYFSKVFRRIDGLSPTQYRAALFTDNREDKIDSPSQNTLNQRPSRPAIHGEERPIHPTSDFDMR